MWLGELVGRGLMDSSRGGLRFVGAMLATGCTVAAIYRGRGGGEQGLLGEAPV